MTIYNESDNKTEKLLRKAIIFVVFIAFILPLISPKVFAASGVTISGGDNVKGGDTFTVAVTYGGGSVGRVNGQMLYDTDKLTYISGGSSSGNTGYVQLKKAGTGEAIVFNIKFQAVSDGKTELQVTTSELYNLDEEYMDNPSAAKTISITGSAAKDELITDTSSPDQPVDSTEAKGVDEKTESGMSTTTLLVIAIAIVAALIIIVVIILISRRKKNAPKAPASKNMGEEYSEANATAEPYQKDEGISGPDIKYDENGNIARRSGQPKGRASKQKISQEKASKKKFSKEETELWDDWSGWDDDDNQY